MAWARALEWGGVMSVCVSILYLHGRYMYLYIVIGGYLRILGALSVQSCFTLLIAASYRVFSFGSYRKSRLACVWLSGSTQFEQRFARPL